MYKKQKRPVKPSFVFTFRIISYRQEESNIKKKTAPLRFQGGGYYLAPVPASAVAGPVGLDVDVGLTVGVVLTLDQLQITTGPLPGRLGVVETHDVSRWVVVVEVAPQLGPAERRSAGEPQLPLDARHSEVVRTEAEALLVVLDGLEVTQAIAMIVLLAGRRHAGQASHIPWEVRDSPGHTASLRRRTRDGSLPT